MTITAGTKLGRYEIRSKIGEGGMGEVYLAHDTQLDRNVALKILSTDLAANQERMRRFVQEAKAASALNHPNIITIHEIDQTDSGHFIAAEFIDGETLRERMRKSQLTIAEVLDLVTQIASALAAAHTAGIIHRDIKPENVMVREDGLVKVLDFGLAKLSQPPALEGGLTLDGAEAPTRVLIKTTPGLVMGTVSYMSPEQARGKEIDARTDTFSLGVMLYEMLAGRLPFAGETTSDVVAAILTSEPTTPSCFNEGIPLELDKIVGKILAKEREERYQSANDLLVDLRRLKKQIDLQSEDAQSLNRSGAKNATQVLAARPTAGGYISRYVRHKPVWVVGLSVLLLATIGLAYQFFNRRSSRASQIESIAVLPFINESGNAEMEYLSDGMTESLISSLSQLPKLSVKARNSVFRFKGKDIATRDIAKQLNVQAILTGRVVQHGQDLTLYVELVDGSTENTLWKSDYHRQMTNLITLQNEIARDVARKLQARLSSSDEQKLGKSYTANPEVYQLILKARYAAQAFTPDAWQKAITYSNQALEKEPNYAPAYAMLASAYTQLSFLQLPPAEGLPKAKEAAKRALEIDDSLADAHSSLGTIKMYYDWDQLGAEREYKRAIELSPGEASNHNRYGWYLSLMGRFPEGMAELTQAQALDPLSETNNTAIATNLYWARQPDRAIAQMQKVFELNPNYGIGHWFLGEFYAQQGRFPEAFAELQKASQLGFAGTPYQIATLGYVHAISGNRAEAQRLVKELNEQSTKRYVSPFHIAVIYVGLGDKEQAFQWLEKAYQERSVWLAWLEVDPKFDSLRSDPRFVDLVKRIGLPQ